MFGPRYREIESIILRLSLTTDNYNKTTTNWRDGYSKMTVLPILNNPNNSKPIFYDAIINQQLYA